MESRMISDGVVESTSAILPNAKCSNFVHYPTESRYFAAVANPAVPSHTLLQTVEQKGVSESATIAMASLPISEETVLTGNTLSDVYQETTTIGHALNEFTVFPSSHQASHNTVWNVISPCYDTNSGNNSAKPQESGLVEDLDLDLPDWVIQFPEQLDTETQYEKVHEEEDQPVCLPMCFSAPATTAETTTQPYSYAAIPVEEEDHNQNHIICQNRPSNTITNNDIEDHNVNKKRHSLKRKATITMNNSANPVKKSTSLVLKLPSIVSLHNNNNHHNKTSTTSENTVMDSYHTTKLIIPTSSFSFSSNASSSSASTSSRDHHHHYSEDDDQHNSYDHRFHRNHHHTHHTHDDQTTDDHTHSHSENDHHHHDDDNHLIKNNNLIFHEGEYLTKGQIRFRESMRRETEEQRQARRLRDAARHRRAYAMKKHSNINATTTANTAENNMYKNSKSSSKKNQKKKADDDEQLMDTAYLYELYNNSIDNSNLLHHHHRMSNELYQ